MFLNSNHIGLYLCYSILNLWYDKEVDFRFHINREKEINIYSNTRDKFRENFYVCVMSNICAKLNLYLNKIEMNNLPCEEIKHELINESIDIIQNNYDKILEYFKYESKLKKSKKIYII